MTGLLIGGVGVLLLASIFVSAAESAAFAIASSHLRTLLDEGFRGAERLSEVRRQELSIRATAFLLNSAFNLVAAGILVGIVAIEWGPAVLIVAIPLVTLGILLVSEGLPRLIASRRSIRLALLSAPVLLRLNRWMTPLLAPFSLLEEILERTNGEEYSAPGHREIREIAELGREEGVIEEEEHLLVERAFRMDELTAWDIMTPRVDIYAWPNTRKLKEVISELRDVPYSRVPVYGTSIDDITGIVYVREAYAAYVGGQSEATLSELAREPLIVPGSLALPYLLRDFQAQRIHMGIVADEFGGTDGLVTLEDILEELVGDIEDETDIAEDSIVRISNGEIEVEGGVELRDINEVFQVSLPHLDYRSLNGLIVEEFGRVPEMGEKVALAGVEIEVIEATDNQVLRARLRKSGSPIQTDEV